MKFGFTVRASGVWWGRTSWRDEGSPDQTARGRGAARVAVAAGPMSMLTHPPNPRVHVQFSNLLGTVYKQGNLLFTPDGHSLLSPVGNRVSVFDLVKCEGRARGGCGRPALTLFPW